MLGFHHFGTFLLFCSSGLLVVPLITAPITTHLSLVQVSLYDTGSTQAQRTVSIGALGLCIYSPPGSKGHDTDSQYCSPTRLGFDTANTLTSLSPRNEPYGPRTNQAIKGLTYASGFLHPLAVACVVFAFLIAAASQRFGFLVAAGLAAFTALIALIVLVVDGAMYAIVRSHVALHENQVVETVTRVAWGAGLQCTAAALAVLLLATAFSVLSCISDRKARAHKMKSGAIYHEVGFPAMGHHVVYSVSK